LNNSLRKHPLLIGIPVILATALLGACATKQQPSQSGAQSGATPATAPALPPPSMPADLPKAEYSGETHWTLHSARLIIKVGKAGRLARLGHNHLVHSDAVVGYAKIAPNGDLSAAVYLPTNSLQVDDQKLREAFRLRDASRYASQPTPKNITATRANMLGERVLDATRYPYLRAHLSGSIQPDLPGETTSIELTLSIRDRQVVLTPSLRWQRNGLSIDIHSEFEVHHQQLGMTAFSALGGALRVAEILSIELSGELRPK
jgi:hypothetical protein